MTDDLQMLRAADDEAQLLGAYAAWMQDHAEAPPYFLRRGREAFLARRAALVLAARTRPESGAAPTRPWLEQWADDDVPDDKLQEALSVLPQAGSRGAGRGTYEELLRARGQWRQLCDEWPGPPEDLTALRTRIVSDAPDARLIHWRAGPEARRRARWIRDRYPLIRRCESGLFRPHLPPRVEPLAAWAAYPEIGEEEEVVIFEPGPGFLSLKNWWIWLIAVLITAFSVMNPPAQKKRRGAVPAPSAATDTPAEAEEDASTEPLRPPPSGDPSLEPYLTYVLAENRRANEAQILAHFERFGRTERELRAAVAGGPWSESETMRNRYRRILKRLDRLRAGR